MQRMTVLSAKRQSSMSSSAGSSLDIPSSPSSATVASEAAAKAAPAFPVVKGEVEGEEDSSSSSSGCEPDFAFQKTYRSSITIQIEDHPL